MRMYFDLQLLQFQTKIVSVKYSIVVCAIVLPGVVTKWAGEGLHHRCLFIRFVSKEIHL